MNVILEAVYTLLYIVYSCCEAVFRLVVPPSPKSVSGQVVLVTGGGKGIGRETALQLASRGATIVLWDIDKYASLCMIHPEDHDIVQVANSCLKHLDGRCQPLKNTCLNGNFFIKESLQSTAADLKAQHKAVHTYICDVSDPDDVARVAHHVRCDVGNVDILVNNAGIVYAKLLTDLSVTEIKRTIDINAIAHFWTLKEFLPNMVSRNHGHLVTVASVAGVFGLPYLNDYAVSKFGARGLMEALERELRGQSGVKLTTVYPSFTDTTLVTSLGQRVRPSKGCGTLLRPDQVAAAIVNGILQNRREVYVPGYAKLFPILKEVLPWKAMQLVWDLLDMRFEDVNEN